MANFFKDKFTDERYARRVSIQQTFQRRRTTRPKNIVIERQETQGMMGAAMLFGAKPNKISITKAEEYEDSDDEYDSEKEYWAEYGNEDEDIEYYETESEEESEYEEEPVFTGALANYANLLANKEYENDQIRE